MTKSTQHLASININDEYGTPNNRLTKAMQAFEIYPSLDVCTSSKFFRFANDIFDSYITKEQDALTQEWAEDFYMNPPYSKVKEFMEKAYNQHLKYNVNALILTYSKTDTKWWHEFVENKAEVHFIKGRIRFWNDDGTRSEHPAPYPSCWIIYRREK